LSVYIHLKVLFWSILLDIYTFLKSTFVSKFLGTNRQWILGLNLGHQTQKVYMVINYNKFAGILTFGILTIPNLHESCTLIFGCY